MAIERPYSLRNVVGEFKRLIFGRSQWLRPDASLRLKPMLKLMDHESQKNQYLMFMIHSSELMPGGSPNFRDGKAIDELYSVVEGIFEKAVSLGYIGKTLREYRALV